MPSSRRRYSPAEKAKAVTLAVVSGNQSLAADETGIPQQRISEWVKSADTADLVLYASEQCAKAAAEAASHIEQAVREAFEAYHRVAPTVTTAEELKHLTTSLAIDWDKLERMMSRLQPMTGGRFGSESPNLGHIQAIIDQASA